MKKYYLIYKITNCLNQKIYIGKHETNNLNDNYMGSGTRLAQAIKKYGIENFNKEILFIFDNKQEMIDKEKEIVNEEFIKRKDVYNLATGGVGGAIAESWSLAARRKRKETKKKNGYAHSPETKFKISKKLKGRPGSNKGVPRTQQVKDKISKANSGSNNGMFGKTHSQELRQAASTRMKNREITNEFRKKMSEATSGINNPMYGKISSKKGKTFEEFYGEVEAKQIKEKISNSGKGRIPWNKGKKGLQKAWNKGKPHSEEHKKNLRKPKRIIKNVNKKK